MFLHSGITGYLMPKLMGDKGDHNITKGISPRLNVIEQLEFELVYCHVAVQHVNRSAMATPHFLSLKVFFIFISTTFRPKCPPAFFRCLSKSGTFTELRTTSFIESTGVACSDSVSHNWVQVLSIPVLLLHCSQD